MSVLVQRLAALIACFATMGALQAGPIYMRIPNIVGEVDEPEYKETISLSTVSIGGQFDLSPTPSRLLVSTSGISLASPDLLSEFANQTVLQDSTISVLETYSFGRAPSITLEFDNPRITSYSIVIDSTGATTEDLSFEYSGWTFTTITYRPDGNIDEERSFRWDRQSGLAEPSFDFEASQDAIDGDYNGDNVVDLADYSIWRNNLGAPAGTLINDPNDSVIGEDQYATWRANFGQSVSSLETATNASVPEPSTWLLLMLFAIGVKWKAKASRNV